MKIYRIHALICAGAQCLAAGGNGFEDALKEELKKHDLTEEVNIVETGCMGSCELGPLMVVYPEGVIYTKVKPEDAAEIVEEHFLKGRPVKRLLWKQEEKRFPTLSEVPFFAKQTKIVLRNCGLINPEDINEYIAQGGYEALAKALTEMTPEDVIKVIKDSGLRGRGGAGFPTGQKWEFAYKQQSDTKYIICNADEGDPGAYMDRSVLEGDPHSVLEGMAIAGYAIGAQKGYIYIRAEYPLAVKRLEIAIKQARAAGLLGKNIFGTNFSFDIELRMGAGAFVCGEETALINSIEGKRGEPRKKPPFPAQKGVFGKPTVINNVETLANVPPIVVNGAEWFKKFGVAGSYGTKLFSLMGDVNYKGVIEIPFGVKLSSIINDVGFGIKGGKKLKGVILGGVSGSLITPNEIDTPVDFNSLALIEAGPGSGSIVVLSEDRCIVDIAKNIAYFFRHESCGKCTPCRVGTEEMYKIIDSISKGFGEVKDLERLDKLSTSMKLTSFCGLGQTAPNIIQQSLRKFREEWLEHIIERKCSANVCEFEEITEEVTNE